MNNQDRKQIDGIIKAIEAAATLRERIDAMLNDLNEAVADYKDVFEDAKNQIEELRDQEQEKFENLSEGLQQSERGQTLEAAVAALDEAVQACEPVDEIREFELEFEADEIVAALDNAKYPG